MGRWVVAFGKAADLLHLTRWRRKTNKHKQVKLQTSYKQIQNITSKLQTNSNQVSNKIQRSYKQVNQDTKNIKIKKLQASYKQVS